VAGHREWSAPVTFDARPQGETMKALTDSYAQSPSAYDRRVTAGSAGSTTRKNPYGESITRDAGHERQGMGAQALAATGNLGSTTSVEAAA
jgi:hypothetical protein